MRSIVSIQLLILLGYSVLFILLGEVIGDEAIGPHWVAIIVHAIILFVLSIRGFTAKEQTGSGQKYLLAFFLVLLLGHGLCVFNGLMHFTLH